MTEEQKEKLIDLLRRLEKKNLYLSNQMSGFNQYYEGFAFACASISSLLCSANLDSFMEDFVTHQGLGDF